MADEDEKLNIEAEKLMMIVSNIVNESKVPVCISMDLDQLMTEKNVDLFNKEKLDPIKAYFVDMSARLLYMMHRVSLKSKTNHTVEDTLEIPDLVKKGFETMLECFEDEPIIIVDPDSKYLN